MKYSTLTTVVRRGNWLKSGRQYKTTLMGIELYAFGKLYIPKILTYRIHSINSLCPCRGLISIEVLGCVFGCSMWVDSLRVHTTRYRILLAICNKFHRGAEQSAAAKYATKHCATRRDMWHSLCRKRSPPAIQICPVHHYTTICHDGSGRKSQHYAWNHYHDYWDKLPIQLADSGSGKSL